MFGFRLVGEGFSAVMRFLVGKVCVGSTCDYKLLCIEKLVMRMYSRLCIPLLPEPASFVFHDEIVELSRNSREKIILL